MHIALFSSTVDVTNGYGNITYEYVKELRKHPDISFTLFLPKNEAGLGHKLIPDVNVEYSLPLYIFRVRPWNILPYFFPPNVRKFDLVHSLFDFPYCFSAALAARRAHKPFVMGVQGTYGVLPLTWPIERKMMMWSYRQAKEIIVPSRFTKEKIMQYARESFPVHVIHNGVDFVRFQKQVDGNGIKERYNGKKILLTVGGLRTRKGHDLVIRALARVRQQFPDIIYAVIGEGYRKKELELLAEKEGVRDIIDFVGNKAGDELVAYFQACDMFVLAPKVVSDTIFEGFGIVYLEAGACGKPVIATDAGGVRDAIAEGKTGIIVPDGDVAALAEAMVRLLSKPDEARQMGEAGREYAQEHDWSRIVGRYIEVYNNYSFLKK